MHHRFESLITAACLAPSGDNTQPWRFVVDGDTIALDVDPGRDPSPMNAGQRMARIALGAALENLLQAAEQLGLDAELVDDPSPHLARVRVHGGPGDASRLDPNFAARATNRRAYDGRPVPPALLDRLAAATPESDGIAALWVVGADRLARLGETIGRTDALMLGHPQIRAAFLDKVRFDRPPAEAVAEGLSVGSLELTASDRMALRVIRRAPDLLLRLGGASKVFAAKAEQLVGGASGLLVIAAPIDDESAAVDLRVGRTVQRSWLALTALGLAAQPMMSLPVLDNVRRHGDAHLREALGVSRIAGLLNEFAALVPELAGRRPAWLLRFGHAAAPSGRTGRLPLDSVTVYTESRAGAPL
jgi:hypothetical protein